MNEDFQYLLDDIDLGIRSKVVDLKSSMTTLAVRVEKFTLDLNQGGTNGDLKQLADIQVRGLIIERLSEEIMTLLTVRKRIQVHGAAAQVHSNPEQEPDLETAIVD